MAISVGLYSGLPGTHSAGDRYIATDGFHPRIVSDGARWRHMITGCEVTPVINSEYTWLDGTGGVTATQVAGAVSISAPVAGGDFRIKAAPATPYVVKSIVYPTITSLSGPSAGAIVLNSANGKFLLMSVTNVPPSARLKVTRHQVGVGLVSVQRDVSLIVFQGHPVRMRFDVGGGSVVAKISGQGVDDLNLYSETVAAFLGADPDKVGFGASGASSTYGTIGTFVSFSAVGPPAAPTRWYAFARMPRLRSGR